MQYKATMTRLLKLKALKEVKELHYIWSCQFSVLKNSPGTELGHFCHYYNPTATPNLYYSDEEILGDILTGKFDIWLQLRNAFRIKFRETLRLCLWNHVNK